MNAVSKILNDMLDVINYKISYNNYKDLYDSDSDNVKRYFSVILWSILKELIVPKIRQQDRKIKDLESRLKVIEDHLVRESSAEFSLAMQTEYIKNSTKKRKKKV